jgi:hypothetical protein
MPHAVLPCPQRGLNARIAAQAIVAQAIRVRTIRAARTIRVA